MLQTSIKIIQSQQPAWTISYYIRPLLLSSCIFPEDERSETVCKSIVDTLKEKAKLLEKWRKTNEKMFGTDHDIPSREEMHMSKLEGATINSDTCNGARLTSSLIADEIVKAVKEKIAKEGLDDRDILVLRQDCHHQLCNVWIGAITKRLSSYLNEILACDLDQISSIYRVTTMMDGVLLAIDKEFSLPANYPKGHGDQFLHWLKEHHSEALMVPVERSSGSRQDLAAEGAAAVYWNRK